MGALLIVVLVGAVWGLSPDRHPDGSDVTGVYAFPADSLHAPHARHTARAQHYAATRYGRAVCARWP